MMLFRKKKPAPPVGRPHTDPFLAIPHLDPKAEIRKDSSGYLQIRRSLPNHPGLGEFFARALGFRRSLRINLDERGTFFWNQVDGMSNLGKIETWVRKEYGLERQESRNAVMLYTKALMLRHLIHLELPHMSKEGPADG